MFNLFKKKVEQPKKPHNNNQSIKFTSTPQGIEVKLYLTLRDNKNQFIEEVANLIASTQSNDVISTIAKLLYDYGCKINDTDVMVSILERWKENITLSHINQSSCEGIRPIAVFGQFHKGNETT
jgi:hypothetical protein